MQSVMLGGGSLGLARPKSLFIFSKLTLIKRTTRQFTRCILRSETSDPINRNDTENA